MNRKQLPAPLLLAATLTGALAPVAAARPSDLPGGTS